MCLHFNGCQNRRRVSKSLKVSSSADLRYFRLSISIETNSLSSGFFENGAVDDQTSEGEKNVALSFSLSWKHFSPNPMLLCGRIVLVARFLPAFYPQILELKDCVLEAHTFEKLLAMDPFFPDFFTVCNVPLEKRTVRSDPQDFVVIRKIDLDFRRLCIQVRNPNVLTPVVRLPILSHHFSTFCWADCQPQYVWQTRVAEFAPPISFVISTYGRMPINIRRIRTIPLKVILARSLTFLSGWTTSPSGVSFQKSSSVIWCLRSWSRTGRLCWLSTLIIWKT